MIMRKINLTVIFIILLLSMTSFVYAKPDRHVRAQDNLTVKKTWTTTTANKYSKNVKYELTITPERTSASKVRVKWKLHPSWANGADSGADSHNTKITATLYYKEDGKVKWSKTVTVKAKGNNTKLQDHSGTFSIKNLSPKSSSRYLHLKASGSGSYTEKVKRTKTITTKSTHYWNYDRNNGTGWYETSKSNYYGEAAKHGGSMTTQYKNKITYSSSSSTLVYYETYTRYTNSGTMKDKKKEYEFPTYIYIYYKILGGTKSTKPKKQGFVYDNGHKVTSTKPKYYCKDIKKEGYTCIGWCKKPYNIPEDITKNGPTKKVYYSVGDKKNRIYNYGSWDNETGTVYDWKKNIFLYAAYKPNLIAQIVYEDNAPNGVKVTNMPKPQNKYYKIPVTLSSKIPKGTPIKTKTGKTENRVIFLYWTTAPKKISTQNTYRATNKKSYNAGAEFNLDYNTDDGSKRPMDKIKLYAKWMYYNPDYWDEKANLPRLRYIGKYDQETISKDSKWRTGERQEQLGNTLAKEGEDEAKAVYDSGGNKVK
jgi:hypothetical protein